MVYTGSMSGDEEECEELVGRPERGGGSSSSVVVAATLEPFVHQVGGHTRMLLLDSATICKPLIQRELNFYRNIPNELKAFTPHFKGVIEVSMERDTDFVTLRNVSPSSGVCRNKEPESNNGNKCLSVKVIPEESQSRFNRFPMEKSESLRSESHNENHFLMLENVASKFYRPCILDLKMGTRQHGDDAPEEKRHRHMAKCAASTSAGLGVRVCGMQAYQADLGMYLCKDKYFGRGLDEEGFKHALHEFFYNGFAVRTGVVRRVIGELRRLRRIVERQNSYRFYSSSLLVVYEGCVEDESGHCDDSEMELASSWESDGATTSTNRDADLDRAGVGGRHGCSDTDSVDVRMIDFAHATYEGFVGDSTVHRGPDNGYMLGLDNLCRVLVDILAETENDKE